MDKVWKPDYEIIITVDMTVKNKPITMKYMHLINTQLKNIIIPTIFRSRNDKNQNDL